MFVFFLLPCSLLPTDIDECVSGVHDCHRSASCTNTVGSYTCTCNHPLSGDGKTCRYTAAGEYFTFNLPQFRLQRSELSSSCLPNMMSKKTNKKPWDFVLITNCFLLWNTFKKNNSPKLISEWCILAVSSANLGPLRDQSKFSFPSGISLPYCKDCYCCN